jgi:hypothetical protein
VNPKQIWLSIKKNLDNKRLISEKTTTNYQQEFRQIGMTLGDRLTTDGWMDVYRKLVYWELELERSNDSSMFDILITQKAEANLQFSRFVEQHYLSWLRGANSDTPTLSHTLFKNRIMPLLDEGLPVYWVVIDNLRYDQWKIIQPMINEWYKTEKDDLYLSILPTATQYARNAMFAGLMPS